MRFDIDISIQNDGKMLIVVIFMMFIVIVIVVGICLIVIEYEFDSVFIADTKSGGIGRDGFGGKVFLVNLWIGNVHTERNGNHFQ